MEHFYRLVLLAELVQNVDQNLSVNVHDLKEIVENLEMKRRSDETSPLEPLVTGATM